MKEKEQNPVTSYRATSAYGLLSSVDFSTVGGKNLAFFELRDVEKVEAFKQILSAAPLNQKLVATTHVAGKAVLVAQSVAPPSMVLKALGERGESFEKASKGQGFNAWKLRSVLGFTGQALQLTSSFLRPPNAQTMGKGVWQRLDSSVFVFAAANLAANTINLVYDQGEQLSDTHQLRYLKQRVNRELSPHLKPGETPLDIDEKRTALRHTDDAPQSFSDRAKSFLGKHSVGIGELGLRYLGAFGLVFPAKNWKSIPSKGLWSQRDPSGWRVYTGLSSIIGKSVALSAEIPDPYNPKPRTALDHFREKFSFLAGGLIEVTSFSALAYDAFFHTSGKNGGRGVMLKGKLHPDWLGGVGATLFTLGYIVRSWAKYGERKVNMPELYAHASDTLAETPPEKIPQLLANTSASLAEHFSDKSKLTFASIYTNLVGDLQRHHALIAEKEAIGKKAKNDNNPAPEPAIPVMSQQPKLRITAEREIVQYPLPQKTVAAR